MKKFVLICTLLIMSALVACAQTETKETGSAEPTVTQTPSKTIEEESPDLEQEEDIKEETPSVVSMTIEEFDELLLQMPVSVIDTKYTVQNEQYKSIYPDMLQAVLINNTEEDIKSAVVAFVAWDENNLPVKIKGFISFYDGNYVSEVDYSDINLAAGSKYGEDSGLKLAENQNINTFKAIVVSYETFEGEEWENPYYDEFCTLYEEKKYASDSMVEVKMEKAQVSSVININTSDNDQLPTVDELEALLAEEGVTIISTEYIIQDEQFKSLYPDILQATIKNSTKEDIKNAVVAFVAWDGNGLPVKIKGYLSFNNGNYIKEVDYEGINLAAGSTYGESSGLQLEEGLNIDTFKAIVVSYETFEGAIWENPHYEAFSALYNGKKFQ